MEAHLPKLVILGIFCMMDAVKESTQKMGKKHPPQHCTEAWMGSRHWSQDPVESARFPSLLLCLFPGPEFCLSWLVNHRVLSLGWHLMQTPQHCLWSQICLPHWDQLAPGTKLSELHRRFWKKCVLRGYKHFISASKSIRGKGSCNLFWKIFTVTEGKNFLTLSHFTVAPCSSLVGWMWLPFLCSYHLWISF